MQLAGAREQQLQVIVELGHRADGGARGAHRVGLVDGDGRRNAVDAIDRRLVHAVEELARVGREGLDVAALAFGVQRVEHQRGLARAGHARHHHQLVQRNVEVEILEIVLARAVHARCDARGVRLRWRDACGLARGDGLVHVAEGIPSTRIGYCTDRVKGAARRNRPTPTMPITSYGGGRSGSRRAGRHRPRAPARHFRVVAGHRVRVVRLLPVRLAGRDHHQEVLLGDERHHGLPVRAAGVRGRILRAAVRRAGVRPARRHGRPQVHLPPHHRHHGRVDRARRLPADVRDDRHHGAHHLHRAAAAAGPRARRSVRRGGDLHLRTRPGGQARPLHELDPDHGDAGLLPLAARHPRVPLRDGPRAVRCLGLARAVPALDGAAR